MKIEKIILSTLKNNKIINIFLDFESIKHFELKGITKTISHDTSSKLLEFYNANELELLIHKDKLRSELLNEIENLDELISIGIELENGEKSYYNLNKNAFNSSDSEIIKIII